MNEYVALFEKNDPNALPEGLVRVNAESSDCAVLVFGSEKVALMDCGLAFCAGKTIENIEKALAENGRDKVDYLFVSHTHYDHVGALPYIVEKWPEIQVVGSAKAQYVFTRPGAIKVMRELGAAAAKDFGGIDDFEPKTDGLRVDIVLTDGETITLGDLTFTGIETKGHTDCSMAYFMEPGKVLFASESTGVVVPDQGINGSEILKSSNDAIAACDKCEAYAPELIICPHYGVIPKDFNPVYFQSMKEDAQNKKAFIKKHYDAGKNEEEILQEMIKEYTKPGQPLDAFIANAVNTIGVMCWEISEGI